MQIRKDLYSVTHIGIVIAGYGMCHHSARNQHRAEVGWRVVVCCSEWRPGPTSVVCLRCPLFLWNSPNHTPRQHGKNGAFYFQQVPVETKSITVVPVTTRGEFRE